MEFYAYMRVSTTKQDTLRQEEAINSFIKDNNISIPEENLFIDYYTGKTFDREQYQLMKSKVAKNDYIIVKEVDRLGRDWDGIKNEWKELKDMGVNIIIIDVPILSDSLPNEKQPIEGLDLRLIKEQILSLMCYSAQKEREKISQRTKEALAQKKIYGTKSGNAIGHPRGEKSSFERFVATLKYMVDNNVGQDTATLKMCYPTRTFKNDLKRMYELFNTKDYSTILNECIKKGSEIFL